MSSMVNEVDGENLQDPPLQLKILATPMTAWGRTPRIPRQHWDQRYRLDNETQSVGRLQRLRAPFVTLVII